MAIAAATFISDTVKFIRDKLAANITDPISAKRNTTYPNRERFVMTSYPKRPVNYPIITVKLDNARMEFRTGMQSEGIWTILPLEIRVWARNEEEKDNLTEQVITFLRQNQFGNGGSVPEELHDFRWNASFDVDEDGEESVKSRIMQIQYKAEVNS